MIHRLPRVVAAILLLMAALVMLAVTQEAEARRFGGGLSLGRQSTQIMKQRPAATPSAAQTTGRNASAAAAGASTKAAGATARTGASRWLGPIAGIAAGLGIAALLSSLGLSGALLEFLSSAILIGLVLMAVLYLVRRLRGVAQPMPANAGGRGNNSYRQAGGPGSAATAPRSAGAPAIEAVPSVAEQDPSWFIPGELDVPAFLTQAKQQFLRIQGFWDRGDRQGLRELLTDDLLAEITPSLPQPDEGNHTEVVLLNAELLGIETVAGGHLASVRYSGMLREAEGAEAARFEEVWNLYKAEGAGWLLAGIQQIQPR